MLTGRVVWITGATGDIGPAVVQEMAGSAAQVVAAARHEDALSGLARAAAIPAERWLAQAVDLTSPAAAETLVQATLARFGRLDILIAMAGGWRGGKTVAETDLETLDWLWQTNLVTAFNAMRAVLPVMIEQHWGRIITFASRSAQTGQARSATYAASKAAVLALTQSLAAETRNQGITANTIVIGTADTPSNRAGMPNADQSRWVKPAQIAATIRFLCSEEATAITGAAIPL